MATISYSINIDTGLAADSNRVLRYPRTTDSGTTFTPIPLEKDASNILRFYKSATANADTTTWTAATAGSLYLYYQDPNGTNTLVTSDTETGPSGSNAYYEFDLTGYNFGTSYAGKTLQGRFTVNTTVYFVSFKVKA